MTDPRHWHKRVLVVDNDDDLRRALAINLRLNGYRVFSAIDSGTAQEILNAEVIDLAIVDKHLDSSAIPEMDLSGVELAEKMPEEIFRIIYTAYENLESSNIIHEKLRPVQIVSKNRADTGAEIIRVINAAFNGMRLRFDLNIEAPGIDWGALVRSIEIPPGEAAAAPDELDVARILQRLFSDASQVVLEPFRPAAPYTNLSTSGSVLLLAEAHRNSLSPAEVVKLGAAGEVKTEVVKFEKIKRELGTLRRVEIDSRDVAYSRRLGGLVYRLIASDRFSQITGYRHFYTETGTGIIAQANRAFFEVTFGGLYRNAKIQQLDLLSTLAPQLHLTPHKLERVMSQVLRPANPSAPQLEFDAIPHCLPNPVSWAVRDGEWRSLGRRSVFCCLVHGDLHNRNILVDTAEANSPKFWLIDFARSDESHTLRDFIELETDIKFTLLESGGLEGLFQLDAALLAPGQFGQDPPHTASKDPQVIKAYRVIADLRRAAAELTRHSDDLREYYEALLVHTLNAMRLRHLGLEQRERALLSAALISRRLDTWPDWEFHPQPGKGL